MNYVNLATECYNLNINQIPENYGDWGALKDLRVKVIPGTSKPNRLWLHKEDVPTFVARIHAFRKRFALRDISLDVQNLLEDLY